MRTDTSHTTTSDPSYRQRTASGPTGRRAYSDRTIIRNIAATPEHDIRSVRHVWVSKFATQDIIFRVKGEVRDDGWFTPEGHGIALRLGRDCFISRHEAALDADSRRRHKITSLKGTLERIEKLITSD